MTARVRQRKLRRSAGAPSGARAASPGPAGAAAQGSALLPAGRVDLAALAAAVLGPLVLYAATLPRTVVLEDDGLFLMAGVHLGVAHPPGYPLYTLIVHLFTRLPFGDPGRPGAPVERGARGAGLRCRVLLRPAAAGVVPPGTDRGVALRRLGAVLVSGHHHRGLHPQRAAVLRRVRPGAGGRAQPGARVAPVGAPLSPWGAGLANHWPLMVLATPGLALALLPAWREVLPRLPRLLGAALLAAGLPYAWMVWLSQQAPAISFYGSIDSWGDFWFYISRQGYNEVDVITPTAGWSDRAAFLGWLGADLVRQTTLPGLALAVLGLGALARGAVVVATALAGSGLVALLGNGVALIALLGFDFDPFWLAVFRPYPLICYGVAALWAAAGLQWLMDRLPGWAAARWPAGAPGPSRVLRAPRLPAAAAALLGVAMVSVSASASWPANDRSDSDFAQRHAEVVFDLLPQDAVLFVYADAIGPLGYYRYVEERRPDIALYNLQGLVLGNRLFDPLLPEEERARALGRFVDATAKPVFLLPDYDIFPADRGYGTSRLRAGGARGRHRGHHQSGPRRSRRALLPGFAGPAAGRRLGTVAAERPADPLRQLPRADRPGGLVDARTPGRAAGAGGGLLSLPARHGGRGARQRRRRAGRSRRRLGSRGPRRCTTAR